MKTIEEKLSDYLDSKSGDSLGSPINALSVGFKDGYNEALRWRDPKKELPDLGVQVQVKVEDTDTGEGGKHEFFHHDYTYEDKGIIDWGWHALSQGRCRILSWRPIE